MVDFYPNFTHPFLFYPHMFVPHVYSIGAYALFIILYACLYCCISYDVAGAIEIFGVRNFDMENFSSGK